MIENPTWQQIKDIKKLVYLITNLLNQRNYVGITTRTFYMRYRSKQWWNHLDNKELKQDILNNGIKNFKITFLEWDIEDILALNDKEGEYAIKYNAYWPKGYNLAPCGRNANYKEGFRIAREKLSKTYRLKKIDTEEIIEIKNMSAFCAENDLDVTAMRAMMKGQYQYSQGYTIPDRNIDDLFDWKVELKNKYELLNPSGDKIIIYNMRQFCKENNFDFYHMLEVTNLKRGHCNGYSNPENPIGYYHILSPVDELFFVRKGEMQKFTKEHNLHLSKFQEMLTGKCKTCVGWRLLKNKHIKYKIKPVYQLKSPDGIVHTFENILAFCKKHNLDHTTICKLLKGEGKQCKSWSRLDTELEIFWFKDQSGRVYRTIEGSLTPFCQKYNINNQCMLLVHKNKRKTHNGWTKAGPPIDYQI